MFESARDTDTHCFSTLPKLRSMKVSNKQQVGKTCGRSKQEQKSVGNHQTSSLANLCGRAKAGFLAHLSSANTSPYAVLIAEESESCLLLNVLLQTGQICYLVSTLKECGSKEFWASSPTLGHKKGVIWIERKILEQERPWHVSSSL